MAESLSSNGVGHNSGSPGAAIRKLNADLAPIESAIADLNEKKRKLRQQFKSDTGMSLADFDAARRLAMIEDDDDRQQKLQNLRTCYNALSKGEQLDWIEHSEAIGSEPGAEAPA